MNTQESKRSNKTEVKDNSVTNAESIKAVSESFGNDTGKVHDTTIVDNQSESFNKKEENVQEACQHSEEHSQCTEPFQKDFDACKQALADWQGKYARLSADFENHKRRIAKEQVYWMTSARAKVLEGLLSIADNFERAMAHKDTESAHEQKSWIEGIAMIYQSLQNYLKGEGVKEVPYNVFDPRYHEALLQVESENHQSGQIVTVMEKGYMLEDRVLRPAKVSVAK